MDIHHCPRCELRFVNTSELRHHFATDHAGDASVFEPYRYRHRLGGGEARTILLVGNQTVTRDAVIEEVSRLAGSDAHVVVLVPATQPERQVVRDVPAGAASEDHAEALARWRLGAAVERLRAAGVDADGRVGPEDPYAAICGVLLEHPVDEIVLSTLPPATSRWLDADLPDRLRRLTGHPVTVVTAAPIAAS